MRYLIFSTLAFLLFLSQTTKAQEWEQLNVFDFYIYQSTNIGNLYSVAIDFAIQKGMFEDTESPFPGDNYQRGDDNVTYERLNTSTVVFYRYNFTLREEDGPSSVFTTVVISYNPSNSNFIITSYDFNINYYGNEEEGEGEGLCESECEAEAEEIPRLTNSAIDTRILAGDGEMAQLFNSSFESNVAKEIELGNLPDAQYTVEYVYGFHSFQSDWDPVDKEQPDILLLEELQNDEAENAEKLFRHEPSERIYDFTFKVKTSEGKYHLMAMYIYFTKDNGDFVFDKSELYALF